jgi:predicted esterase
MSIQSLLLRSSPFGRGALWLLFLGLASLIFGFRWLEAHPTPQAIVWNRLQQRRMPIIGATKSDPRTAPFALVLPQGHDHTQPLPCAIYLHGFDSNANDLFDSRSRDFQHIANYLRIGFIGITASRRSGDRYQWSEDVIEDQAHIDAVLALHTERVEPEIGRLVLFGFSQGAKVAGHLAALNPDRFAGAVLFAPRGVDFESAGPTSESLRGQRFFCVHNVNEPRYVVATTRWFHERYQALGAESTLFAYPYLEDYQLPPDFYMRLPDWLHKVLSLRKSPIWH